MKCIATTLALVVGALASISFARDAEEARDAKELRDPTEAKVAPPLARELWLGTEGRFVRQWLLLGPVSAAEAGVLTSARREAPALQTVEPIADQPATTPDEKKEASPRWRAHTSWGDVVKVLRPSPSQPDRYVMVIAPTSTAGLNVWDPGGFWGQENGYPKLPWDFTIVDGREVAVEEGLGPERGWIAVGVFDRHWRRDDAWVFTGSERSGAGRILAP